MSRTLTFAQAVREATEQCMERDPAVLVVGEGVPDPKAIFSTTAGLAERFGARRVRDMPLSEEGMTGAMVGAALRGLRPVLTHQRVDFALLSMNQIVNNAAKWHYMFDGKMRVPLVVRMVIGMGWGQGAQHSQSLHSWFAHIPGLKVLMPATPHDAKGMLVSAIEDDDPVLFLEHRWLHNTRGEVPEELYRVPVGRARTAHDGDDLTVVATSYMTLEALKAARFLRERGVGLDVVDVRSVRPYDRPAVLASVRRTGRLLVADGDWASCGFSAEVIAAVAEDAMDDLACPPRRVTWPDVPVPSSPALANAFYPRAVDIARAATQMLGRTDIDLGPLEQSGHPLDVPDPEFMGPF